MRISMLVLIAWASVSLPMSASADQLEDRFQAFARITYACKAQYLIDSGLASSLIRANVGSLSSHCECVALTATASLADAEIQVVLNGTDPQKSLEILRNNTAACVRMGK